MGNLRRVLVYLLLPFPAVSQHFTVDLTQLLSPGGKEEEGGLQAPQQHLQEVS